MKTPSQSSDLRKLISARGAGGETHQSAQVGAERLTTETPVVIADDQNSVTAGSHDAKLPEDIALLGKPFHFDYN